MLGPADGVANRSRLVGSGGRGEGFRYFQKHVLRYSALLLHEFRGVPAEVTLQHLKNAPRMLQGFVRFESCRILRLSSTVFAVSAPRFRMARWLAGFFAARTLVEPGFRIVLALVRVPTGKETVGVFGIAKVFT